MKSQRLQAHFIRKRELEQAKAQQTQAVQKYYDKWGRITTLHEHWTTPEYYKESEEKLRKRQEAEEHQKKLVERKSRLKMMLSDESKQLEMEIKVNQRPRTRQVPTSILESVRQTLSNAEEAKKRADLESSLYSRWRLGLEHEKILKDSRSDREAMAKLSWLDRQLETQMINEQKQKENKELELKLEQEKRKHESFVTNCQQLRDSEIINLKTMQTGHIQEVKLRDREAHDLKLTESTLRKKLVEIQKEISDISTINNKRRDRVQALHNYRRIKMLLRERSEAIKRDLQLDLNLLDRISFDRDFDNNEEINYLREKFQNQHDQEAQNVRYIETMYDSEAKESLQKMEEKWNDDAMVRERQLKVLMEDRIQTINDRIIDCVRKQQDLMGIRETHLKAIEDCNQRLKELMNSSLLGNDNNDAKQGNAMSMNKNNIGNIIKQTDSMAVSNGHQNELTVPKYGRKKVCWT